MPESNRVVLIQPNNTLFHAIYPPLSLVKIGSALQQAGYDVSIITCPMESNPIPKVLKAVEDALLVGIGVLTPEVPHAVDIAKAIKKHCKTPIVWGGWHVTLFPEQTAESELADWVIVDEGDHHVVDIAQRLSAGHTPPARPEDKILRNDKKLDLGALPAPDYDLVPNIERYITSKLSDKFLEYDERPIRWLPYEASRGCPGKCAFCINVVTKNRRWRRKPAEKVLDEIRTMVEQHKLNHIKIIDDNFFVNTQWVATIAQGLIDLNLDITWDTECRADYFREGKVDDDLLKLCVRAGMNEINFGIESGSASTLARMKKGVTPEQNYYAVKKASEHGIVSRCSFIIDIPGDTREDILHTVSLINKIRALPKTTCGVHTYRPYPKSELCEVLLEQGTIAQPTALEGWADEHYVAQFTYADAVRTWQNNHKLSRLISFYQNLESGFWLKPHQLANSFLRGINSLFMRIGKARNQHLFFRFPVDMYLYKAFRDLYLKYSR